MKTNIGTFDRVFRVVAALVAGALIATNTVSGTWAIIFGILAVAFLATSAMGFCPLYAPFKISTRRIDKKA